MHQKDVCGLMPVNFVSVLLAFGEGVCNAPKRCLHWAAKERLKDRLYVAVWHFGLKIVYSPAQGFPHEYQAHRSSIGRSLLMSSITHESWNSPDMPSWPAYNIFQNDNCLAGWQVLLRSHKNSCKLGVRFTFQPFSLIFTKFTKCDSLFQFIISFHLSSSIKFFDNLR